MLKKTRDGLPTKRVTRSHLSNTIMYKELFRATRHWQHTPTTGVTFVHRKKTLQDSTTGVSSFPTHVLPALGNKDEELENASSKRGNMGRMWRK